MRSQIRLFKRGREEGAGPSLGKIDILNFFYRKVGQAKTYNQLHRALEIIYHVNVVDTLNFVVKTFNYVNVADVVKTLNYVAVVAAVVIVVKTLNYVVLLMLLLMLLLLKHLTMLLLLLLLL